MTFPGKPENRERGRLLIEMIIGISIIAVFSAFIVNKQLERQAEIEEMNVADGMRTLNLAVKRYMEVHRRKFETGGHVVGNIHIPVIDEFFPDEGDILPLAITDPELRRFLPEGFDPNDTVFSAYRISIKRSRPEPAIDPEVYNPPPIRVVIISDNRLSKGKLLDNLRAARIASLLGSAGGYIGTDMNNGVSTFDANGNLSLWQLDMRDYFVNEAEIQPVRVVSALGFNTDRDDDIRDRVMFRDHWEDYPEGNTMFTNILWQGPENSRNITNLNEIQMVAHDPATGEILKDADGNFINTLLINGDTGEITVNRDYMKMKQKYDHAKGQAITSDGGSRVVAGGFDETTAGGKEQTTYGLKFDGETVLNELRLEALGGAKLSDILPRYSLKKIHRNITSGRIAAPGYDAGGNRTTEKTCPVGYAPVVQVMPYNIQTETNVTSAGPFTAAGTAQTTSNATLYGETALAGEVTATGWSGTIQSTGAVTVAPDSFPATVSAYSPYTITPTKYGPIAGSAATSYTSSGGDVKASTVNSAVTPNVVGAADSAKAAGHIVLTGTAKVDGETTVTGTGTFKAKVDVAVINQNDSSVRIPDATGKLVSPPGGAVQTVGWDVTLNGFTAADANVYCRFVSQSLAP
jgi:type II secretory pathway pseudopilin PulG